MSDSSINAVKDFIGGKDNFFGKVDASVITSTGIYIYNNIDIRIQYNFSFEQMTLDIIWEDDESQPSYQTLCLHGTYNSNFQNLIFSNHTLQWKDGESKILIKMRKKV